MISRVEAKTKLKLLTEHTSNKLAVLVSARSVIDSVCDSVGRCDECLYSEKTTDTRWKCEYLDDIRVRSNFFCADYIKGKK